MCLSTVSTMLSLQTTELHISETKKTYSLSHTGQRCPQKPLVTRKEKDVYSLTGKSARNWKQASVWEWAPPMAGGYRWLWQTSSDQSQEGFWCRTACLFMASNLLPPPVNQLENTVFSLLTWAIHSNRHQTHFLGDFFHNKQRSPGCCWLVSKPV